MINLLLLTVCYCKTVGCILLQTSCLKQVLKPVQTSFCFSFSFWLMLMTEEISDLPLNEKKENKHFCFKKNQKKTKKNIFASDNLPKKSNTVGGME
jgi:hypothetical protein